MTAVIYLTEESAPVFAAALERAGIKGHPDLHILYRPDCAGAAWPDVMAAAIAQALDVKAGLIVVDTAAAWMDLTGDRENDAGAVGAALAPVKEAVRFGFCVLVIHHDRKAGGDTIDAVRGSGALTAGPDLVVHLLRGGKRYPTTARRLTAETKLDAPAELIVDWSGKGFRALEPKEGTAEAGNPRAAQAVQQLLPTDRDAALTRADLVEKLGAQFSESAIKRAVRDGIKVGAIATEGGGGRRKQLLWRPGFDLVPPSGDLKEIKSISSEGGEEELLTEPPVSGGGV